MKNRIRSIRKEQNITLKELSQRTGISVGYLCHLERGTRANPTFMTLNSIAKAMGKDVEDIFNSKKED